MQLTYGDVVRSIDSLSEVLQLKPAPTVGVAVKIARNSRKLNAVAEDFRAAREAVVETIRADFTETWVDEDGEEQTGMREARVAEFEAAAVAEINDLMAEPVEVDVRVIPIADLEKCEEKRPSFEITSGALFNLWYMFGLDEPEPEATELGSVPIAEAA